MDIDSEIRNAWEDALKSSQAMTAQVRDKIEEKIGAIADLPFDKKKEVTSALRRLQPGGAQTIIVFTTNHRNLRHMITMRASSGAEEEIRSIFTEIARDLFNRHPMIYQDIGDDREGSVVFSQGRV